MPTIEQQISEKVLTVGPDYRDHRGGIGAVIAAYQVFFGQFKFIPSYKYHASNFRKIVFFLKQVIAFARVLGSDKRIKIVHIHGSHGGSFYRKFILFLISKKLYGKKVIYHIHSDQFDTFYFNANRMVRRLIRYNINNVDLIICLAPVWERFFQNNFHAKKLIILNNAISYPVKVDFNREKKDALPVRFLFLGKIGIRKGIFDILEVLRAGKDRLNKLVKLYVGGDGDVERLRHLINVYGLHEMVEYVGWIQGDKKNGLFLKADVYILPSYSEGLPISILEAMSYQLPIISSPVGGIPEIVKVGINGFLVEPGDLQQIEKSILFFIDHPDKIQTFGQHSLRLVGPYLPSAVAGKLREIYIDLLNLGST